MRRIKPDLILDYLGVGTAFVQMQVPVREADLRQKTSIASSSPAKNLR